MRLCSGVFASMNLINNLPDLVLCFVVSYLTAFERICKVSRVCKRWHSLIKSSSQVWKCVNFAWLIIQANYFKKYLAENTVNTISEPLDFKIFWGGCPQTPLQTRASGARFQPAPPPPPPHLEIRSAVPGVSRLIYSTSKKIYPNPPPPPAILFSYAERYSGALKFAT